MKLIFKIFLFLSTWFFVKNSSAQGVDCFNADPFCTGSTENFPNVTGDPGLGSIGCLGSSPNPAWYYLNIATSGDINIHIEQYDLFGSPIDVDFICWGPVTSVATGCGTGIPATSSVDCSYSAAAVEDCYIPTALAGETYILLLTNFADQPGNITFSQTSGTGATDCSILCGLSGLTAVPGFCDVFTNTYTLDGSLNLATPPTTGTLTVSTSCGGSQVFAAPFPATINYSILGMPADGSPCTVTVSLSADTSCTATTTFIAPLGCTCSISSVTASPTACNLVTMSYDVSGVITFVNSPPAGNLTVSSSCGGSQVFSAPFTSPLAYTITGIPGGSSGPCTITAVFSAIPACTLPQNYTSPNCCAMTVNTVSTPALCASTCDGTATATFAGNISSSVTIVWQDALGNPIGQTGSTATGLCPGTYIASVSDSTICTVTSTIVVGALNDPTIDAVNITLPSCNGVCDAVINLVTTNADQFSINNGATFSASPTFNSLCDGNYIIIITNPNGCTATQTVTITDPLLLVVNLNSVSNVLCTGQSNGSISISVGGGTFPFTYSWTGGSTLQNPTGLPAGSYTGVVIDANGCTATVIANITEPTPLTFSFTETDATCYGQCNGILTSAAAGGTTPYNFAWTGPINFNTANSNVACAGVYTLLVTDNNGCSVTSAPITVGQPAPLVINYVLIDNEKCYNDCNGKIEINATGATFYSIDNGATFGVSTIFSPLCAGTYTIVIQDVLGCNATQTVNVISPAQVISDFTFTPNPADLFNTTVQFTNLSQAATMYNWTFDSLGFSGQFSPVFDFPLYVADTYYVCLAVVNDSGCVDTTCLNVPVNDYTFIYLPNTFTPNGDGNNDIFIPFVNLIDNSSYQFLIFNRWGEVIFSTDDPTKGWDGTHNQIKSKEDVYVWKVKAKSALNAEKKEWVGHVNLLR